MIITCSLGDAKNYTADLIYFIVTNPGAVKPKGFKHRPDMGPSRELYAWAMAHKSEEGWFDIYKKQFCYDMKHLPGLVNALNELERKAKDKVILLVCFCPDVNFCHRGLEADELISRGVEVEKH